MTTTPSPQIADYLGRTVDHLAFDDMSGSMGDTLLTQALVKPGESGALITGIEKLAQRFLIELMTEKGTLGYLPNRGTQFMIDARAGYWRTVTDVEQSFYGAMLELEESLVGEEEVDDPLDEKFDSAELLDVSVSVDLVVVRVQLQSLAGETREVIYPLRVNPIGA